MNFRLFIHGYCSIKRKKNRQKYDSAIVSISFVHAPLFQIIKNLQYYVRSDWSKTPGFIVTLLRPRLYGEILFQVEGSLAYPSYPGSPFDDGRVTLLGEPTFLHINTLARPAESTTARRDRQSERCCQLLARAKGSPFFSYKR